MPIFSTSLVAPNYSGGDAETRRRASGNPLSRDDRSSPEGALSISLIGDRRETDKYESTDAVKLLQDVIAQATGMFRRQRRHSRRRRAQERQRAIDTASSGGSDRGGATTGATPVFRATQATGTPIEDAIRSATRTPGDVISDVFGTISDALGVPRTDPNAVIIGIPRPTTTPGGPNTAGRPTSTPTGTVGGVTLGQAASVGRSLFTMVQTAQASPRSGSTVRAAPIISDADLRRKRLRATFADIRIPIDVAVYRQRLEDTRRRT